MGLFTERSEESVGLYVVLPLESMGKNLMVSLELGR